MSIEREYSKYTPACDICGMELEAEDNFQDAVDAKKVAGWKSKKQGEEWQDICLDCQRRK